MKNVKLGKLWYSLHSSYWFLPTIFAIIAIALAFTMLWLDRQGYYGPLEKWGWIYTGGANGAREVLSSVSSSTIGIAATAFSITIVALQLAASNFGPRLLRNFMQDTGNQIVLGTFISTFIYSLLVLRTIRGDGDGYDRFVPQLSVTVGLLLAIASIGVLIYFIHHASTIIQVSHVIWETCADLDHAIARLFPEKIGQGASTQNQPGEEIPVDFDLNTYGIRAQSNGYLQAIDDEELMKLACQHNLLLRLNYRPGQFIVKGCELILVYPRESINRKLNQRLKNTVILGKERTEQQDVEFPIEQLVEIALRAISPGINDPFTAIRCIDRLGAGLSHLAQRDFPSPYRYDNHKKLRVIAERVTFTGLVDTAFNQIRQYGKSDVAVMIRLLEAIAMIARFTSTQKERVVLLRHAEMIKRSSQQAISEELDRQDIEERYLTIKKELLAK
ncbi:hypothetical protein STA3757_15280 [Stanieria sp. NIES-3757]|nr:hypothetical protein STA3757_15280 [Stanieria sp. NIES-3757]